MKSSKNPAAVALGKQSVAARKKKMGQAAFTNHMRKIASNSHNGVKRPS